MPIDWRRGRRASFHLRNGAISYVLRVLENGSLGHLYFGPALRRRPLVRATWPGRPFPGFANRLGEPVALEYPTCGHRRLPGAGARRRAAGRLDASSTSRTRATGSSPGKPPLPGPAGDLRRGGRRGRDRSRSPCVDGPSGLEVELRYTIFRDLPASPAACASATAAPRRLDLRTVDERVARPARRDWELVHAQRRLGPRAPRRRTGRSCPGAQSVRQPARRVRPRAQPVPARSAGRRRPRRRRGDRPQPRLLGQLPRRGGGRPVRHAPGLRIGIDPDGFALGARARRRVRDARRPSSSTRTSGLGGAERHVPPPVPRAPGPRHWRDRPRPILINNWEGTYFDFDEAKLRRDRRGRRERARDRAVRARRRLVRRARRRHHLARRLDVDRRKLPDGLDGLARADRGARACAFGLWIEPEMVSPRSRLFEEHPDWAIGVPGRPRTEGRQPARPRHGPAGGRRPPVDVLSDVLGSAPISYVKWDMNRNITEPYSRALPPDRQGEFFHRYILGVYELYATADARPSRRSCSSRAPAAAAGSIPGCSPSRRRPGRATTRTPSSGCGSSGGRRWSTRSARWAPTSRPSRTTRSAADHAARDAGRGRLLRRLRLRAGPDRTCPTTSAREVADQVAFYKPQRDVLQRGRFVRLREPVRGRRQRDRLDGRGARCGRAVVGFYQVLNQPEPGPRRLRLRGLDPAATYRVSLWPAARRRPPPPQRGSPRRRRADGRGPEPRRRARGDRVARRPLVAALRPRAHRRVSGATASQR